MRNLWMGLSAALLSAAAAQAQEAGQMDAGKAIFDANCAICHKANGEGVVSTIPKLNGDENLSDPYVIAYNVHEGVVVMPPFPQLSDADIAAVATYIRNSWGNSFGPVTTDEVAAITKDLEPVTPVKTIWDGPVFTQAQADRGKEVFNSPCGTCHGSKLNGAPDDMDQRPAPPLARAKFLFNWDGRSLGALVGYTKTTMPQSNPGFLPEEDYLAIVAYMLSLSGAQAGDVPLSADIKELGHIMITPKP